ncbi:hypothetical protein [Sinorhizobium sp. CCBAU 05631]|nr:hypothetical protein [Sinorhizobium sp. CCBAU 05631]ASY61154.1 hypothetical protein SS05631_a47710 [Sinorhizobium sp. CCBAU 05631]
MSNAFAVDIHEHEQAFSDKDYEAARAFFYRHPLVLAERNAAPQ